LLSWLFSLVARRFVNFLWNFSKMWAFCQNCVYFNSRTYIFDENSQYKTKYYVFLSNFCVLINVFRILYVDILSFWKDKKTTA
jgi:hypothetical protein